MLGEGGDGARGQKPGVAGLVEHVAQAFGRLGN
jgi:hypothetical protein